MNQTVCEHGTHPDMGCLQCHAKKSVGRCRHGVPNDVHCTVCLAETIQQHEVMPPITFDVGPNGNVRNVTVTHSGTYTTGQGGNASTGGNGGAGTSVYFGDEPVRYGTDGLVRGTQTFNNDCVQIAKFLNDGFRHVHGLYFHCMWDNEKELRITVHEDSDTPNPKMLQSYVLREPPDVRYVVEFVSESVADLLSENEQI